MYLYLSVFAQNIYENSLLKLVKIMILILFYSILYMYVKEKDQVSGEFKIM